MIEVLLWLIGGLFVAIIMLLSYALMNVSSSTNDIEEEIKEFEEYKNRKL